MVALSPHQRCPGGNGNEPPVHQTVLRFVIGRVGASTLMAMLPRMQTSRVLQACRGS
ncbi:hypothetical protein C8T65DRAFT_642534 [Cerioporus squamosus]|nr:hypothetical protein C8T65DRAFT_642534 [Cerioporus squamosus]